MEKALDASEAKVQMPLGVGREADLAANLAIQEIEISAPTASEQALPLSWSS